MKLRDLLAGVPLTGGNADLNMEINSISYDSRTLEPGALFVTLSGSKTDGHRYVAQALEKGAAAILCREPPRTGSWLSTPDPRTALAQSRVEGLTFQAGVFTNLTQDHLDYHGTMEAYRRAKGRLFRQSERAVLNLDDEAGRWYRERIACPSLTYSENKDTADLTAKNIRLFPGHVEFEAVARGQITRVHLPIPGGFTIYNALAALACGLCLDIPLDKAAAPPACGAGGEGPGGGGACPHGLHRHHRLCPHAGCPGEHPYHRPGLHCGPADLCVRLRRRPGPGQAPPHGGGGRRAG